MTKRWLTSSEVLLLAELFSGPLKAERVLERAGIPRSAHPSWNALTPLDFWGRMNDMSMEGDRERILASALADYPFNESLMVAVGR